MDTQIKKNPFMIAHRGASGYLPEHTLPAKALAYGMGADYLEQDIVLTRDRVPIVLHDIHVDTVTDVAKVFPSRARKDGRYYAIDFDLDEIKRLSVHERIDIKTGKAVFPNRFPVGKSEFRIPTLAEEIEFIQGLNHSTGREVGLYPEIKKPAWHLEQDYDISHFVLTELKNFGLEDKSHKVFLQCFDPSELKRIREELGSELQIIQLIGSNDWGESSADYDRMLTGSGLDEIKQFADGIGPWLPFVIRGKKPDGSAELTGLVEQAKKRGLEVHPYTLRADALPDYTDDFDELLRLVRESGVDGFFSDFPDRR